MLVEPFAMSANLPAGGLAVLALAVLGTAQQAVAPAPVAAAAPAFVPVQQLLLEAAVAGEVRWLDDVVELRRTVPGFANGQPDVPDLTRHAALLVPAVLPTGHRLAWRRALLRDGEWRVELQLEPLPPTAFDEPRQLHGAVFVVPRVTEPVRVFVPIAAERSLPAIRLPAPATGEVPNVLAVRELTMGGGDALRCVRAATPAEWRELRASLGEAGKGLPDDYADFARHCVVMVAPARARALPGFALAASTEEGVDVLTITQRLPSGSALPEIAPVALLVLPRRPRQLAVVFADHLGAHSTATLFEPLR